LRFHDKPNGYVDVRGGRYPIKAKVITNTALFCHAGQRDLVEILIKRMRVKPGKITFVHGDDGAKAKHERVDGIGTIRNVPSGGSVSLDD